MTTVYYYFGMSTNEYFQNCFSVRNFFKICSKAHQIASFKNNSWGLCPRTPLARGMQLAQTPKKLPHPPRQFLQTPMFNT